ncbi:hypothetical protein HZS55_11250 [Halosimplex rubrum]|uniref:Cox cluster protein n=1 Tax=Halosimplex rubrum TaxID=869889 RepID=A0A7D5P583_9EURY|nr:hypothetical protein [Halosimplex rubrum]QLH77838.1 hypothetical protein HZS55_11250 [Halosimplex rubrum]
MKDTITTTIDRAAMALGGGLILLGVVGLGIVEVLAGPPYGAAPTTNDAGEVVATPMVDANLRVLLVIAGLVVLLAWQGYRMAATAGGEDTTQRVEMTAD